MIHEEICTYEVCKLAKKNGFDGSGCFKHYDQNGLLRSNRSFSRFDLTIDELYRHDTPSEVQVYAPTQSLLQRWLREKKGIMIGIVILLQSDGSWRYRYKIQTKEDDISTLLDYSTYELALEDALKYAFEILV